MIDTSDAAIEADLALAERGGTPGAIAVALGRAQLRATLRAAPTIPDGTPPFLHLPDGSTADIQIAQGPFGDSYAVPHAASFEDRVTVAARLLGMPNLAALFEPVPAAPEGDDQPLEAPAEPDFELDIDDDLEAGGTLDQLEEGDDIDADFFREAREARDQ